VPASGLTEVATDIVEGRLDVGRPGPGE